MDRPFLAEQCRQLLFQVVRYRIVRYGRLDRVLTNIYDGFIAQGGSGRLEEKKMRKTAITALILSLAAGNAFGQAVITPTTGPTCKDESDESVGMWICPGPGGYVVRFADEGNIVSLTIAPARSMKEAKATVQFRAAGDAFGNKMRWVLHDGVPKAVVIRTWRRPDDDDRGIEELTVFTIDGTRACSYGAVSARQSKANEIALAKAEEAAGSRCAKD